VTRRDIRDAILVAALAPVFWVHFPLRRLWLWRKSRTFEALDARRCARDFDLDDVVTARWFTYVTHTIASGAEEIDLFEVTLTSGETIVVARNGRFARALAASRGIDLTPISLGDSAGIGWLGWLFLTGVFAVGAVLLRTCARLA
jgi:hypothetical protein